MMSASGFPCIEGDFSSHIHFCEEERKQAESYKRIIGFLSCFLLASFSARHAAPNSALLEELPSSPRARHAAPNTALLEESPLCSSSLK